MLFGSFLAFVLSSSGQFASAQGAQEVVLGLERDIQAQQNLLAELKAQEAAYEEKISRKQAERITLSSQVSILEDQMRKIEIEIESVEGQVVKADLEIKKLEQEVLIKNSSIVAGKEQLSALVRMIHDLDRRSAIEMLVLNDRFSEIFAELSNLESVNGDLRSSLADLMVHKEELDEKYLESSDKKRELEELHLELERKKEKMASQQQTKAYLLEETRSSERQFQSLLSQAKAEQESANYEIVRLQSEVKERLKDLAQEEALSALSSDFAWPVPRNVITSYFHDPDYPYRHIFEHPAVDIRAGQGTRITASASGYVARAKDAGYGYSYIMLVHSDNLATVYGHVSCILVGEETFVTKGQEIGCVGGLPGTKGAGRLTTGPHLHFEVRQNGIPVNPLNYLP